MNKFKSYLEKKGVTLSPKLYFVDAMSAMALGLFASLLMGTIFGTVLKYIPEGNAFHDFFTLLSGAGGATGAMIGVAIAYACNTAFNSIKEDVSCKHHVSVC